MQNAIEISIYSSAMTIAVLALSKLFSGKISAKVIHILWLLVLLRLLLPVTFELPVGIPYPAILEEPLNIAQASEEKLPETQTESDADIDSPKVEYSPSTAASENASESESAPIRPASLSFDARKIVFIIWLGTSALFLAVNLLRIIVFRRKLKQSISTDIRYEINLGHGKKLLGIKRKVRIAEADCAGIPFVFGCLRPTIIMPRGFLRSIGDEKMSYIIMHELCHVKRHDLVINYVWLLARSLHWFNPLVHVAYKNYLTVIEEACDEMVAKHLSTGGRCEYTQSMLDVIRLFNKSRSLPLSVSFGSRETAIRRRVMKMMHPKKNSKAMLFAVIAAAGVMVFACFTTACQPEKANKDPQLEQLQKTGANTTPEPASTTGNAPEQEALKGEDEIIAAIKQHGLSEIGEAFLANAEDYFGDRIISYRTDGGSDAYSVLESDLSLVAFNTNQVSCEAPIGLSEEEYESIVADYIKRIWDFDKIEISKHEVIEQRRCTEEFNRYGVAKTVPAYVYSIKGTMGENKRPFSAHLNGEGKLYGLISFPVEVDLGKGITKSEAHSRSLEYLEEWRYTYPEIDVETLILAEEKISFAAGGPPSFAFNYEYRSGDPSADDYDFDCEVKVSAANGALQGFSVVPIVDNIDIISMEEAKSLARQYVIEKSHAEDIARLKINSQNLHTSSGEIVYSFGVQYTPENPTDDDPVCYYSVRIYAATGKLMSANITS